ncbi:hypothetical protein QZH41_001888 [Actinostola sp. cb2023]|nr:hypothetical protein QZH41_001888 [Actinostola sp. cb2023]
MPHHYSCCVPGCTNSFRNAPNLQFYRIPKDVELRKTYKVILRNETLKLDSQGTRVCSAHFEGGEKICRNHLPTIFPWIKEKKERRELKRQLPQESIQRVKKQKYQTAELLLQEESPELFEDSSSGLENDASIATYTIKTYTETACQTDSDIMLELTVLKEKLLALEEKNESLNTENEHLKKEVDKLNYALDNPRFDIDKYKDSDEDIAFYSGFPDYNAMMLCYKIVEDSAKNMSYDHERVYIDMQHKKPGRRRVLTVFQEFTLVMMRLRLGLFERDIAHRFSVSVTSVSRITRTWIRFLRCEFEPLINIPPNDVIKLHMPESVP